MARTVPPSTEPSGGHSYGMKDLVDPYLHLLSARVLKMGSGLSHSGAGVRSITLWREWAAPAVHRRRSGVHPTQTGYRAPHSAATCRRGAGQVSAGARQGKGGLNRPGLGCAYLRVAGLRRGTRRASGGCRGLEARRRRTGALRPRAAPHPRPGEDRSRPPHAPPFMVGQPVTCPSHPRAGERA